MAELWFDRDFGDLSRRGGMLYVSRPGGVWAIFLENPVYPDNLAQESNELLGNYGASAGGIGYLLLRADIPLPPSLEKWATAQHVPAAQLGAWVPCLISIDGAFQLALSRDFDGARVFATTWANRHLTILTPSAELTATLVHQGDLKAPPPGWDQRGGVQSK